MRSMLAARKQRREFFAIDLRERDFNRESRSLSEE
jgi:hypothetical protein